MTTRFQPPPTWALPIILDETTQRATFNPVWLNWFLLLQAMFSSAGVMKNITMAVVSVAGASNVTLTPEQAANSILEFTGALTGDIQIILPAAVDQWTLYNNTTGAFIITIKCAATAGLVLEQGFRGIFYCNGTVIARSNNSVVG